MNPPISEGQEVELTIDRLTYGGEGIGRLDGFAIFVPRTAPQDRVIAKVQMVRKRFARAHAISFLEKSPLRIEPICKHFERCGGCHTQHINPEYIQKTKVEQLKEAFVRLGPGELPVEPLVSSGTDWNYRNRVTFHRADSNQGYVAWDNHKVLDVDHCPIARPKLNELWEKTRDLIKLIPSTDLPFVVLRETSLGECAIVLSSTKKEVSLPTFPKEVSVFVTIVEKDSYTPFGSEFENIQGASVIREKIGNVVYELRPDFFFQINNDVTEKVVQTVRTWAKELNGPFLDLYCGAGLFSLALADIKKNVLGVEINHLSIEAAKRSAELNHFEALASFRAGKVETVFTKLRKDKQFFPAAIVDPPRKGLRPEVLEQFSSLKIENLLYVSCSPPTLARDLKELKQMGYEVETVIPFDMFPQTYHVETVVQLVRKSI